MTILPIDRERAAEYLAAIFHDMPVLSDRVLANVVPLAAAFAAHREAERDRCAKVAPAWRSGIGFGAFIIDSVREQFGKSKSPALHRFNAALDRAIQEAFDLSRSAKPATYQEAQAAERAIAAHVAQAIRTREPNA